MYTRDSINPADWSTDWEKVQIGMQIEDEVFCVIENALKLDKNQNPFREVLLSNCYEQRIKLKAWQDTHLDWDGIEPGDAVQIKGRVEKGWPEGSPNSLKYIADLEKIQGSHPVLAFMNPVYQGDVKKLVSEFDEMIAELDEPWRVFVQRFFETGCPREQFLTCPAAKGHHHAYIHGLLDHTMEVTRFARSAADNPSTQGYVNRNVVIAGALIHDAGKVHEYVWEDKPIGMSEDSLLMNHMLTGPLMVMKVMNLHREELARAGFTFSMAKHLMHIQASHHGQAEWGAVVPPATPAAMIVHNADMMSAKVRAMTEFIQSAEPNRYGRVEGAKWGTFRNGIICDPGTFGPRRTVPMPGEVEIVGEEVQSAPETEAEVESRMNREAAESSSQTASENSLFSELTGSLSERLARQGKVEEAQSTPLLEKPEVTPPATRGRAR